MHDADRGGVLKKRRAARRMEVGPARRRRLRAARIVGVDMPSAELDAESRLNRPRDFGGAVKVRQASDDERFDVIREGRHRFLGFLVL